jgi:threonine aldolase
LCAVARVAIDEVFFAGFLEKTHLIASDIAATWQKHGGKLKLPTETNMIWLDFGGLDFTLEDLIEEAAARKLLILRPRLVVHYREPAQYFPALL